MLGDLTISLTSVLCWVPALILFVVFLAGTVYVAQKEVSLKKSTSILLVSSVYIFCLVGLLWFVLHSEELAGVINQISLCLLVTLVLYASSPISLIVSLIVLAIVYGNKVGFDNI